VAVKDYASCNDLIKSNHVTRFLHEEGYEISNYSIFDFDQQPSLFTQYFIPMGKKLIKDRTFFNSVQKDIGWALLKKLSLPTNPKKSYLNHLSNNNTLLDMVHKAAAEKNAKPRFIYAHFLMPHSPFFFDGKGERRNDSLSLMGQDFYTPSSYLGYVGYVNIKIRELITTIQEHNPSAVIILMGDHGFRNMDGTPPYPSYFQNLNAVYFPNQDYHRFYDTVSAVNQFRVIFNSMFNQSLPMLKDSCIFLSDK
jgi:hypothetical protein